MLRQAGRELYQPLALSLGVFSRLIKLCNAGRSVLKQFVLLILAKYFPVDSTPKPDIMLVWLHDGLFGELGAQVNAGPALSGGSFMAPKIVQGNLTSSGLRFAIVASRVNEFITSRLLAGALDALERSGTIESDILVVRVPGSFEIPLAAKRLAESKKHDAIICLGTLIRGDTPHFEYISSEVTKGIASVSLEDRIPVAYGVLTADSVEQAIDRAGLKSGNKGFEAAMSAVEMANLLKQL